MAQFTVLGMASSQDNGSDLHAQKKTPKETLDGIHLL